MDAYEEKAADMDQDALAKTYQSVFGSPEGKIVLADLRRRFFKNTSTAYVEDEAGRLVHVSAEILQRNEGMRIAVLHIENNINHQPKAEAEAPQESGE